MLQDLFLILAYVAKNKLQDVPTFHWTKQYLWNKELLSGTVKAFRAKIEQGPKIKFGVKVPRNQKYALQLDQQNQN